MGTPSLDLKPLAVHKILDMGFGAVMVQWAGVACAARKDSSKPAGFDDGHERSGELDFCFYYGVFWGRAGSLSNDLCLGGFRRR